MSAFRNLAKIVESLEVDPSTADDPIKRTFVVDGTHLTANVAVVSGRENSLRTQADYDGLLVIVGGDLVFRVGDEVEQVRPVDPVFMRSIRR